MPEQQGPPESLVAFRLLCRPVPPAQETARLFSVPLQIGGANNLRRYCLSGTRVARNPCAPTLALSNLGKLNHRYCTRILKATRSATLYATQFGWSPHLLSKCMLTLNNAFPKAFALRRSIAPYVAMPVIILSLTPLWISGDRKPTIGA